MMSTFKSKIKPLLDFLLSVRVPNKKPVQHFQRKVQIFKMKRLTLLNLPKPVISLITSFCSTKFRLLKLRLVCRLFYETFNTKLAWHQSKLCFAPRKSCVYVSSFTYVQHLEIEEHKPHPKVLVILLEYTKCLQTLCFTGRFSLKTLFLPKIEILFKNQIYLKDLRFYNVFYPATYRCTPAFYLFDLQLDKLLIHYEEEPVNELSTKFSISSSLRQLSLHLDLSLEQLKQINNNCQLELLQFEKIWYQFPRSDQASKTELVEVEQFLKHEMPIKQVNLKCFCIQLCPLENWNFLFHFPSIIALSLPTPANDMESESLTHFIEQMMSGKYEESIASITTTKKLWKKRLKTFICDYLSIEQLYLLLTSVDSLVYISNTPLSENTADFAAFETVFNTIKSIDSKMYKRCYFPNHYLFSNFYQTNELQFSHPEHVIELNESRKLALQHLITTPYRGFLNLQAFREEFLMQLKLTKTNG
jgi:hypothetical protein